MVVAFVGQLPMLHLTKNGVEGLALAIRWKMVADMCFLSAILREQRR